MWGTTNAATWTFFFSVCGPKTDDITFLADKKKRLQTAWNRRVLIKKTDARGSAPAAAPKQTACLNSLSSLFILIIRVCPLDLCRENFSKPTGPAQGSQGPKTKCNNKQRINKVILFQIKRPNSLISAHLLVSSVQYLLVVDKMRREDFFLTVCGSKRLIKWEIAEQIHQ